MDVESTVKPQKSDGPPRSLIGRIVQFPLVLLIIGLAIQIIVLGGISNLLPPALKPQEGPMAVVVVLIFCIIAMIAHWAFNRYVDADPANDLNMRGAATELGAGLGFGFGLFALITAVVWMLGGYTPGKFNGFDTIWPMLAFFAIIPGVTEEILFRGLVFRYVERAAGSWIALLISAALFGAAHLANPNASLTAGIAIAIEAGIMLGAVYMLTRRLWAAIGVHAAWNFTQGWVFGIPVSGIKQPGLIDSTLTGPDWLTGGEFGLEASLVAMILATVAGLILLWMAHKRGRFVAPMWVR